ncbi:MAG: hypothetical protein R3F02_06610 [Thiolinea sp.]
MLLDSRTRPVHHILEAYLPPHVLAYALRIWSEHYLHMNNISMLSFVDAFYYRQPLPYSRQHIYNSLMPALMEVLAVREHFDEATTELYEFPDYDLPDNPPSVPGVSPSLSVESPSQPAGLPGKLLTPAPVQQQADQSPSPVKAITKPVRDERFEIFSLFIIRLMKPLSAEKRKKMLFYYRKGFMQAVQKPVAEPLYDWLAQTNNDYFEHPGLDNEGMRNIAHTIYTGLCNYLGPLEADDVLMKAVNLVDDKFSRDELDIRELL